MLHVRVLYVHQRLEYQSLAEQCISSLLFHNLYWAQESFGLPLHIHCFD